uniref:Secreted protein n=1 Tax=Gibberella zeae (strain ATCC MYA-4620 / CBS 123657 / FGSC 9075 / NRRL 31084 / PH-1) TaxID=229533 RepID=A0A098CZF4_GIBZE
MPRLSILAGSFVLLAFSGVNAGPCRPSSSTVTTSLETTAAPTEVERLQGLPAILPILPPPPLPRLQQQPSANVPRPLFQRIPVPVKTSRTHTWHPIVSASTSRATPCLTSILARNISVLRVSRSAYPSVHRMLSVVVYSTPRQARSA